MGSGVTVFFENGQLDYTESKIKEELGRIFKEMYAPHRNYSNDEVNQNYHRLFFWK